VSFLLINMGHAASAGTPLTQSVDTCFSRWLIRVISLSHFFSHRSRFFCWCRAYWYPIKISLVEFAGITTPWFTTALIICHSTAERQTFSLAAMADSVSPSAL
jgi:hypothetical protein